MMKLGPKSRILAVYVRDVYTLRVKRPDSASALLSGRFYRRMRAGKDRGYAVFELAGYRTVAPIPMSVLRKLVHAGVKRLRGRFKRGNDVREALRRIK